MNNILITGGTGYIGSHVCVLLLNQGYQVTILDNLSNSQQHVVEHIAQLSPHKPELVIGDIRDKARLDELCSTQQFDAVMHFAGSKYISESIQNPLHYYDNNVKGSITLFQAMQEANITTCVFSSSATVYADSQQALTEQDPLAPINPYGDNKLTVETILRYQAQQAQQPWRIANLRYFNPIGAHPSGLLGEEPSAKATNLLPVLARVCTHEQAYLPVFGHDYDTKDGSPVRDYIHVMDLAQAHIQALTYLQQHQAALTLNLGTGQAYSVLEVIETLSSVIGQEIPYQFEARRDGDHPACWADPSLAYETLGWQAQHNLDDMCTDYWRWIQQSRT